ncbi:MAG: HD family hydrolase [Ahrensia sp.]|nr:HD family hydrolase [Ahrensia sp.]
MPDRSSAPKRAWQRMLSGRRLDLLDPSPVDVEIEDIAHGLARVARWNGQTNGDHAFSVAQHSLLVEQIVGRIAPDPTPALLLHALLHDAPEYVIGDMISPVKQAIGDGGYRSVEERLQSAINLRFGLAGKVPAPTKKIIKQADMIAAYYEATRLAGFSEAEAVIYFGRPTKLGPDGLHLTPLPTGQAEEKYLARFEALSHAFNPLRKM